MLKNYLLKTLHTPDPDGSVLNKADRVTPPKGGSLSLGGTSCPELQEHSLRTNCTDSGSDPSSSPILLGLYFAHP